jgi:phage terminase large subunit
MLPLSMQTTNPRAEFPSKLRFLFSPAPYKIAYGGRASGKSWGFARALLIQAAQQPMRVLCARELQVSIADSVHCLLSEQIPLLGLERFYSIQKTEIRGANGSEFIFSGLKVNIAKVKSMEGLDRVWAEEAETVSEDSWSVLLPTIRKGGSELWVSFNPRDEADATYRRFVTNPPPGAVVERICWDDNPWLPARSKAEKDHAYRTDPEAAAHVWGGECRRMSNAQVLRGRYVVEPFEIDPTWDGPYHGIDFGYAVDPSTMVRCYVHGRTLYVSHEAYGIGVELDNLPALFDEVPGAREYMARADNSRPETISHLNRHGYGRVVACAKGAGSVEDGVEYLRAFERIVIHQRCRHTAEEARLWSFKQNAAGDVLPELVDRHNHCMDALRYALEPLIKTQAGAGLLAMAGEALAKKVGEERSRSLSK